MVTPEGREILTRQELTDLFEISRINKAGAVFDTVKLTWMNKQYLAKKTDHEILELVGDYLDESLSHIEKLDEKILSLRDNIETLSQINDVLDVYVRSTDQFFQKFQALPLNETDIKVIEYANNKLLNASDWNQAIVSQLIDGAMDALSLGKGKVMKPFRKSMTGEESGPNLVDCLALIPLSEVKIRLGLVLDHVNSTTSN